MTPLLMAGGVQIAADHQTATLTGLAGLTLLVLPGDLFAYMVKRAASKLTCTILFCHEVT